MHHTWMFMFRGSDLGLDSPFFILHIVPLSYEQITAIDGNGKSVTKLLVVTQANVRYRKV
jgi:hypothetical protein